LKVRGLAAQRLYTAMPSIKKHPFNGNFTGGDIHMNMAHRLRELLATDDVLIAPGAYDALSALTIEQTGFSLMGTTGYGMHGTILGTPDIGQLSYKEMLDAVSNITDAVSIPVLADAEGGYGNAVNVVRTVRAFERAGVAGMFIEDQQFPPNCPFVKQTEVISTEEMCGKIRAAVEARSNPDFLIVARSDAPFEEAIERAEEYRKAGADMIKIIPKSKKELETLPARVKLPLHLGFMSGKEINRGLTAYHAAEMGYKIISFPMACLFPSCFAMRTALQTLLREGTDEEVAAQSLDFDSYARLVRGEQFHTLEKKYIPTRASDI